MSEIEDNIYMQRCLELAQNALGNTYPNPMVGSVIVYNNTIIGEGFHAKAGEAHAEINAINSVANKELLSKSTLYVNLEPCSHYGKTPPCSLTIIEHKIPRVVIGCIDTYKEVWGRGIEMLKKAGIEVTVGVLEKESKELNKRFFTFHTKKRPYIILKWAQTQDGFIDIAPEFKYQQKGIWITDEICKKRVHEWRVQEQSILIGTNTAEIDNPQLTSRLVKGKNPLRIVIDIHNRLAQNLHVKDGRTPTLIFTETNLKSKTNLEFVKITDSTNIWNEIFLELHNRGIQSLIIEGGAKILEDCISKNLWDEMRVFTGPILFHKGILAPKISSNFRIEEHIGNSILRTFFAQLAP